MNTPCPNCGLTYTAPDTKANQNVTCPLCGKHFVLPPLPSHHGKTWLLLSLAVILLAGGTATAFYLKRTGKNAQKPTEEQAALPQQTFQETYHDILSAITRKDVMTLGKLLKNRDLKDTDEKGNTLLWYAVASGSPDVVQTLLLAGLSPNHKNQERETPILEAIRKNDLTMCQFLLKRGATLPYADCSDTAWGMAAEYGAWKILQWLNLTRQEFAESGEKPTAIARALKNKHMDCVTILLDHYNLRDFRDPNGNTLAMLALQTGNHDFFLQVFSPDQLDLMNLQQQGYLYAACQGGNVLSVEHLLKMNAPLNDRLFSNSPLRIAILKENVPIINDLILAGISTQGEDQDGNNALMLATIRNNLEIFMLLDAAGNFELLTKNKDGKDIYELAKACTNEVLAMKIKADYGKSLLKEIKQEATNLKKGVNERKYCNKYTAYLEKYPDLDEVTAYLQDEKQRLHGILTEQDTKNLGLAIDKSFQEKTTEEAYNMLDSAIKACPEAKNMEEAKKRLKNLKELQ